MPQRTCMYRPAGAPVAWGAARRRLAPWPGLLLLLAVAAARAPAQSLPPAEDFQIIHQGPGLSLHDEMYFLPYSHADRYHGSQAEIVFQLSAKQRLLGSRFYLAYTQLSYWQAYYLEESSPFRNTDYNPEAFYRLAPRPWGAGSAGADAGLEHQSNGQRGVLSRSWNQVYVAPHFRTDRLLVRAKLRWRIPEDPKETPESAVGDDNPDITDYLGHADLNFYYRWPSSLQLHFLVRGNLSTGRGFTSLNLSRQLPNEQNACLVFMLSHGYGESLLDYDRKVSRVGFGFMLAR